MRTLLPFAFCAAACGTGPTPPAPTTPATSASNAPNAPTAPTEVERAAARDPRALAATATFGDLVEAARALDDSPDDRAQRCLLDTNAAPGFRFAAETIVGVRPLPTAPADLDAAFGENGLPARIYTRWGEVGPSTFGVALTTFTDLAPPSADASPVVLALTDRGAQLRGTKLRSSTDSVGADFGRDMTAPELGRWLEAHGRDHRAAAFVVTAEGDVPVSRLEAVLRLLAAHGLTVAFGVPLAGGTRLPETASPTPEEARRGLCPDGLSETTPSDATLTPDELLPRIRDARGQALACLSRARTPRGVTGGLLEMSFRVDGDGRVVEACASRDEIGDHDVRACITNVFRGLRFPSPSPLGTVDVAIPLRLTPTFDEGVRAVCASDVSR